MKKEEYYVIINVVRKMTFVFKPSENVKKKMIAYYEPLKKEKTPPYAVFQAQDADTIVTLYESGKVMFQGISADIDVDIWRTMERNLNGKDIEIKDSSEKKKEKTKEEIENRYLKTISTAGSDEVGTGDYFGPIIVTATFVPKEKLGLMNELGVNDSKKVTDDKIKKIAPELMKEIPYVTLKLSNKEYNELKDKNMNKIKAVLHNKALVKLFEQNPNIRPGKIVIDQFVYPKKYFEHISDASKKITNILFLTKAEHQVYSVAAASLISRYLFLREMKQMSKELGATVPLGAGVDADNFAQALVKQKGFNILYQYAKINFKNTEKLKEIK